MEPTLVVLPIHDREEYVQPCIDSLQMAGADYELCIVANGCDFNPGPYLEQADHRFLTPESLGPPLARNEGLKFRRPEQDVLSLDSDIVFQTPEFLSALKQVARSEGWGMASPAIDDKDLKTSFHGIRPGAGVIESLSLPVGARFIRGAVCDQLGYFRSFGPYGGEDLDWDARARAAGWRFGYNANVVVTHPGIPSDDRWKRNRLEEVLPKLKQWEKMYDRGLMLHKPDPEPDFIPEMNPRWLASPQDLDKFGSHLPALQRAVEATTGPILELGVGYHSTPYLNRVSKQMRQVVSVEPPGRWQTLAKRYESPAHWIVDEIPPGFWDVVLLDSEPGELRGELLERLRPYTKVFVIHDTEVPEAYGLTEEQLSSFADRTDHGDVPRTTVVSDHRLLSA